MDQNLFVGVLALFVLVCWFLGIAEFIDLSLAERDKLGGGLLAHIGCAIIFCVAVPVVGWLALFFVPLGLGFTRFSRIVGSKRQE